MAVRVLSGTPAASISRLCVWKQLTSAAVLLYVTPGTHVWMGE